MSSKHSVHTCIYCDASLAGTTSRCPVCGSFISIESSRSRQFLIRMRTGTDFILLAFVVVGVATAYGLALITGLFN